ncbi:MAG: GGDEF domain-containing protein, partial [Planctomycetes bacterium]|nr:GGDEF domain-containing protein [Planctomycetota bacterium]
MSGWSKLFKRAELTGGEPDLVVRLLDAVASILQGAQEEETFREIRAQIKEVFACDDVSLFFLTDEKPTPDEGEWVLRVRAGFGEGNRVTQADARSVPALVSGKRLVASDFLTEKAVLKAVALAFDEDCFYGCDIENKKVVLLKNPTPEDDMGSGDLSVLAIPLRHQAKVGRVVEKTRVGVLVLYKTPVRRDLAELERPLRSVLAHAVVSSRCQLRDPVTGLFTEAFLKEELGRQVNLFDLTGGKLMGGLVVGHIDTLHLYRQTLESAAKVDPAEVSQRVSDVLRGVSHCVQRRASDHALGAGADYKCGYVGRIGHDDFGVILPRLSAFELCMWGQRLAKEVVDHPFQGEEMLPQGEVTVTLRVIPFGGHGAHAPEAIWKLGKDALDEVVREQNKLRNDAAQLRTVVNTLLALGPEGRWVAPSELSKEQGAPAAPSAPAAPVHTKVAGLDLVDDVTAATTRRVPRKGP